MTCKTWSRTIGAAAAAVFAVGLPAARSDGHGTLDNGRMIQVRKAGPAGGTPAAWNDSYYTWNQDSRNFPDYAAPGFKYSTFVPDGTLASAGANDGTNGTLNFAGLNAPSPGWAATPARAGAPLSIRWLATAPHDPSYFDVWLSRPGYDPTAKPLGWADLDYLGRWSIGDATRPVTTANAPSPIDGSTMLAYDWQITVPADRAGRAELLTVWQRVDPAGESFWAVQDLSVTAVPEPSGAAFAGLMGIALLGRRRRRGCA